MKIYQPLLTLFLLFASHSVLSQTEIPGNLRPGDTTQIHVLFTSNGDRLSGTVITIDESQITFVFNQLTTLTFSTDQVRKIEVIEKPGSGQDDITVNQLRYTIELKRGDQFFGILNRLDKEELHFQQHKLPDQHLSLSKIKRLSLLQNNPPAENRSFQMLETIEGDQFRGRLLHYENDTLEFQLVNGTGLYFALEHIAHIQVEGPSSLQSQDSGSRNSGEVPEPTSCFIYRVKESNGRSYTGELHKLYRTEALLKPSGRANTVLRRRNLASIELAGLKIDDPDAHPSFMHVLTTSNKDRFIGQLQYYDGVRLEFLTENGATVELKSMDIRKLELIGRPDIKRAGLLKKAIDDNSIKGQQRIIFSPTAFTLKEKMYEYSAQEILYSSFDTGISDHVTIGGSILPLVIFYVLSGKIKVGTSLSEKLHIAAGAQGYFVVTFFDNPAVGGLYSAMTLGDRENYLSFWMGRGTYTDAEDGWTTVFGAGGAMKISNHFRLVMEFNNMEGLFEEVDYFGSFALSWYKNNNQFNFGATLLPVNGTSFFPVPMITYSLFF